MMADTTLTDDFTLADGTTAFATVTLWDGITLPAASELDAAVADAGGDSPEASDLDAVANHGDGLSPRGENSENDTNEPTVDDFDARARIIQNEDPVGVAANSPVDAGLDEPGTAKGPEEGLTQESHVSSAGARDPDPADPVAGGIPRTQLEMHQYRWLLWEAKKREEQRRREEKLKARDAPAGESIVDIGTAPLPPMAAETQEPQLPRSP